MTGIYLKHGDAYLTMNETAFDAETVLQELIERHPEMLAGDDAGHGPLLLVKREAGVADAEDAGTRWSLDHLYLDASGVPTLVEVKRSSDTRARREVVAQMLDYAANAKASFNIDQLQAWIAERATIHGRTVVDELRDTLAVEDTDAYWAQVATNLAAERLRLIFVSDAIAPELRTIIEFLNGQMARTEVLAIEVKQYTDTGGAHQTIVPRVVGDTEQARQTKATRGQARAIDRTGLLAALAERDKSEADAAGGLLDWAEARPEVEVWWSKDTANIGVSRMKSRPAILRIWTTRGIEVRLQSLRTSEGWDDARCDELIARLQRIDGLRFDAGRQWPKAPLAPLADPDARREFTAVIEDVFVQGRGQHAE
jgi:hypothetical protein